MTTPQAKLRDYLKSVPDSSIALAINAVLGSLIINCTDEDIDTAITVVKGLVKENEEEENDRTRILSRDGL